MLSRAREHAEPLIPIPDTPSDSNSCFQPWLHFHVYTLSVCLALIARRNNYIVNRSAEVFRVMGCHCWTQWPEDFYRVKFKKASVRNGCRLATRLSSPFDRL